MEEEGTLSPEDVRALILKAITCRPFFFLFLFFFFFFLFFLFFLFSFFSTRNIRTHRNFSFDAFLFY